LRVDVLAYSFARTEASIGSWRNFGVWKIRADFRPFSGKNPEISSLDTLLFSPKQLVTRHIVEPVVDRPRS